MLSMLPWDEIFQTKSGFNVIRRLYVFVYVRNSLVENAFAICICFTLTSVNPRLGCWLSSCLTGMLLKAIYPSLGLTNVTVNVDLNEGSSKHGKARRA